MSWLKTRFRELQNEWTFQKTMFQRNSARRRGEDLLHPFHPTKKKIKELIEKPPYDLPARFGVLFIGIPKTACTAIRNGLFPENRLLPNHAGIRAIRDVMSPTEFEGLFKFGFVRNPFQRLLSAFTYLCSEKCGRFDKRFARRFRYKFSFSEFAKNYLNPESVYDWMHLVPQWEFISNSDKSLLVDFVGRYENIEQDYATLREKLQVGNELRPFNVVGKGQMTEQYYDEEIASAVYEVYKTDFEMFGYSNDSWKSIGPC